MDLAALASSSKPQSEYYTVPFKAAADYSDEAELRAAFPSLAHFNQKLDPGALKNGQFFIIRSKKSDDLHKAAKYGVWTSSFFNNKKFRECYNSGTPVYFLFTILKWNMFVGLARLVDRPDLQTEFPYWGEIGKWKGIMRIEWLLIRDAYFDDLPALDECAYQEERPHQRAQGRLRAPHRQRPRHRTAHGRHHREERAAQTVRESRCPGEGHPRED